MLVYQFWNMSTVCSGSSDGVNTLLLTNVGFLLPSPHDIQTLGIDVYGLMFLLCEIMQLYELQMFWIWIWRSWLSSVVLLCPVTPHHKIESLKGPSCLICLIKTFLLSVSPSREHVDAADAVCITRTSFWCRYSVVEDGWQMLSNRIFTYCFQTCFTDGHLQDLRLFYSASFVTSFCGFCLSVCQSHTSVVDHWICFSWQTS